MMYTVKAETFELTTKTGTVISAFCDATKNQTKLKIAHADGHVSSLTIPTASEKRLQCLKNGTRVTYDCTHEAVIEKNGCRYYAEKASRVGFIRLPEQAEKPFNGAAKKIAAMKKEEIFND